MQQVSIKETKRHMTSRSALLALGLKFSQLEMFQPVMEQVQIQQKTVKDTPGEKLLDGLLTILAGGKGMVEANKRVRPDVALQRAFGRQRCAEQSVISETLDACDEENVKQMQSAMSEIYRRHSLAYRHDYEQDWQLLDVDMSGQPCGEKAAFATSGYFAKQRNRRGRQLGRVLASWYEEIVIDRLYAGRTVLPAVLQELVLAAAAVLELDESRRQRTILRVDSHGGSQDDVNWILAQGYQLHSKEYSGRRATKLAQSVQYWYDDPAVTGRQVGWVELPASEYNRPVRRIAVRTPKKNGHWAVGVLISTLAPATVAYLMGLPLDQPLPPLDILMAYVHFYDLRGGGIETAFKEDKQALGITKRNKQRFEAQAMLVQLNALGHNLLVWFRHWLARSYQAILQLGLFRLIRDVLHLNGLVSYHDDLTIADITLTQFDPWAVRLANALRQLLSPLQIDVYLAET
jgi:hypothetical protein